MKKLISLSFLAAVAAVVPAPRAEAQIAIMPTGPLTIAGVPISVACKNPGSSQDVAKTPSLTNTTSYTIAKGRTLMWKSSDGDSGSHKLEADLAPGASVKAMGKAGNAYTCAGTYLAYPDLRVASVAASGSGYTVKIQNLDKHAQSAGSTVKIEFLSCSTNAVIGVAQGTVPSVFAGGTANALVTATKPGKSYMRITADSSKQVVEGNESNNTFTESLNVCLY